jgi:hypothetical protein
MSPDSRSRTRHGFALTVVAALSVVSLAACKGSKAKANVGDAGAVAARAPIGRTYPTDVKPNPIAVRVCDVMHTIPGQRRAACCAEPPQQYFASECVRVLSASLEALALSVVESQVEKCATAMTASLEGCSWVTPGQPLAPKECQGLLEGLVAEGGACRSQLDCKNGLHCGAQGTCVGPEAVGAACGRGVDQLATLTGQRDLDKAHPSCAEHCSMVAHKCEAMPTVGAPCFAHVNCAPGQMCLEGRCAAGNPGKVDDACSTGTCEVGLRCLASTKKCVPFATSGEGCNSDFDCGKGACSANESGARVCKMTCSHAGDLPALRKAIASPPPPHSTLSSR